MSRCFLAAMLPNSKETELGSSDQEDSLLARTNTRLVLV